MRTGRTRRSAHSPPNIRQHRLALFLGDLEEGFVPLGPLVIDEDVLELGAERVRYQGVGLEGLQRMQERRRGPQRSSIWRARRFWRAGVRPTKPSPARMSQRATAFSLVMVRRRFSLSLMVSRPWA